MPSSARILVVDDDARVRRSVERVLTVGGFSVEGFEDAQKALGAVRAGGVGAVLSDIRMPGMDGLELLRAVRAVSPDLPVLLLTGSPELQTAIDAVEYGATQYLVKPLEPEALLKSVRRAVFLGALAVAKRRALGLVGDPGPGDPTELAVRFDSAREKLWIAVQPVVDIAARRIVAYEALLRTGEAAFSGPQALLDAAERLGRVHELGQAVRAAVARIVAEAPEGVRMFVNIHPSDLEDDELYEATSPLSRFASRVVIEVTERHSLDGIADLTERVARLRRLGYRMAVDDLGAGYAGLTSVVRLQPEVVKLDMSLVRGCDTDVARQGVIRSMAELSGRLGMEVVVEGVETEAEATCLQSIGCSLHQGYRYARPAKPWPAVAW